MTLRPRSLAALLPCLPVIFFASALAARGYAPQAPATTPTVQAPQQPAPKKSSPFENVPGSDVSKPAEQKPAGTQPSPPPFEKVPETKQPEKPAQQQPQAPKPEAAKPAETAPAGEVANVVEAIEFRGARRVSQDTLKALIFTKKGDALEEDALHRDFMALWNTGRFDDVVLEREKGKSGWILRFNVTERRVVRSIKYDGNKSITVSEILDRFKERHVGLAVEQQYEQSRVARATQVLKEFLAEKGRQFASVTPQIRQIPPSSVEVTFKIDEGVKVKVGKIEILGNSVYGTRAIIRVMKNSKPIGIPHSIFMESLFASTYDSSKLDEDMERIRQFYMSHGYFKMAVLDHKVEIQDSGGEGAHIPLFYPNKPGKKADIQLTVEEGRQYHLGKISFVGVKLFRTPETLMRPIFGMAEGDVFSTEKLQKGFKNLQKLYGEFGYIDAVPEPDFDPQDADGKMNLTINVDEGKQFFVRRIDFSGNTTTRDKVIRREIMLDEGDMYNTRLWEMSVLRLNQLGYFEVLKAEEAAAITRDTKNNTVDITLKVKERGKNSISLNGGVSAISGTFIGLGYSTNNFLGMGETLSLNTQLGTMIRSATFGFTEPYLFDLPLNLGFTVYMQRYNYDQARQASLLSGQNLIALYNQLGTQNLLNYVTNGYGATVFVSYPLRRSFARVGVTYGIDRSSITPLTTASTTYFNYSNFQNLAGPNQLHGIITSKITPSYTYNTIDHPITPSRGQSMFASMGVSGIGGNVETLEPTLTYTRFMKGLMPGHVIGFRILGRMEAGYNGRSAPPFSRIFMGGEQDVRGFENYSIGPFAYIPSTATVPVLNADGSARQQKVIVNGAETFQSVTQSIPSYQIIYPGGDTEGLANFEYRIKIFGPLVLALFADAGVNHITFRNQLKLNPDRISTLNGDFPTAGFQNEAIIIPGSQKVRTSVGAELQIMMPVVNAPFRVYWAYNPTILTTNFQSPIAIDPTMFPNRASYVYAASTFGQSSPYDEKRSMFRFTISRTF
jgi:outer membrane protein insertion porin family